MTTLTPLWFGSRAVRMKASVCLNARVCTPGRREHAQRQASLPRTAQGLKQQIRSLRSALQTACWIDGHHGGRFGHAAGCVPSGTQAGTELVLRSPAKINVEELCLEGVPPLFSSSRLRRAAVSSRETLQQSQSVRDKGVFLSGPVVLSPGRSLESPRRF